jgi:hypothetical protein
MAHCPVNAAATVDVCIVEDACAVCGGEQRSVVGGYEWRARSGLWHQRSSVNGGLELIALGGIDVNRPV